MRVHIVVEQRCHVVDVISAGVRCCDLGLYTSSVIPPLAGSFADLRHHSGDIDQLACVEAQTRRCAGESSEGVRHDDGPAGIRWALLEHTIDVLLKAGRVVLTSLRSAEQGEHGEHELT